MTAWKVAMTPDASDWAEDDLRWDAGFHLGLWRGCKDEAEAVTVAGQVTALGWTAEIKQEEDGNAV